MKKSLQDPKFEINEERELMKRNLRDLEKIQRQRVRRSALDEVENEIHLLKHFDHPCLPRLRASYKCADKYLVVIDYYKGGCLQPKLEAETTLPPDVVATIIRDILEALQCIHSMNVVHRDVKFSNILLTDPDLKKTRAVLADFGLAALLPNQHATVSDQCGTESFMAPEVTLGMPYSFPCDIYAVGVCLYWMIFGEHPMVSIRSRQNAMVTKLLQEKERERKSSFTAERRSTEGFQDSGPTEEDVKQCFDAHMTTYPDFVSVWNQSLVPDKLLIDFIKKLMHLDPRKRLTAAEALKHSWILINSKMHTTDALEAGTALIKEIQPLNMHKKLWSIEENTMKPAFRLSAGLTRSNSNINTSTVPTPNHDSDPISEVTTPKGFVNIDPGLQHNFPLPHSNFSLLKDQKMSLVSGSQHAPDASYSPDLVTRRKAKSMLSRTTEVANPGDISQLVASPTPVNIKVERSFHGNTEGIYSNSCQPFSSNRESDAFQEINVKNLSEYASSKLRCFTVDTYNGDDEDVPQGEIDIA